MAIDWMALAQDMRDELVAHRRDFHQHPELSFEEVRTASIVAKELSELGLEVQTGIGKTGVVGILDGDGDGPTVLVRCDMDALPVEEANDVEYASQTPGKMHACGHDGHTAIALGVAKMMAAHRDQIKGRIKFVFQPAEEIAQGALAMIKDGVLSDPVPDVSVGLHLWTNLPLGEVGMTPGPVMGGTDVWKIVLHGKGGHGAMPDKAHDPIVAGAAIITALQTIVSRNVSALESAVVSATMFHGGTTSNVIPDSVEIAGGFRFYTTQGHDLVERRIREIAGGVAASMECEADITMDKLSLPVVNDPAVTARLQRVFDKINPPRPLQYFDNARWMAAEDMAFFLEKIPGTYILLGAANHARHLDYPHHHPRFDFDEDALPIGAGLLATAIADYIVPR